MDASNTARPRASRRFEFTRDRVDTATCELGKSQTLYWDTKQPGLGLRVTASGSRAFIFESKLGRETIRLTIGPASMQIRAAKDKRGMPIVAGADTRAAELAFQISQGKDPRAEIRTAIETEKNTRAAERRQTVTAREAWDVYLADRKPMWSDRHYQDHVDRAIPVGNLGKRGKPLRHGPLAPLLALPLHQLDTAAIEKWAAKEAKTRPTVARLGWRLLKAFLGWCAAQDDYKGAVPEKNPAKSTRARESLGVPGVKRDTVMREQLKAWFAAVGAIHNPVVAALLQTILLTGARPGEVREIQWEDVNTKWNGLTIRDKIEGERVIPLTPYVAHLLAALPRRNEWVFSGIRSAVVASPHDLHAQACAVAGLEGLTLHGLRRSFKSLTEWLDIPAGVVAQLMGHKPSATAEKHYTYRPLDLLRIHHGRIEAWVLEQAGIAFDPAQAAPAALRVVS